MFLSCNLFKHWGQEIQVSMAHPSPGKLLPAQCLFANCLISEVFSYFIHGNKYSFIKKGFRMIQKLEPNQTYQPREKCRFTPGLSVMPSVTFN